MLVFGSCSLLAKTTCQCEVDGDNFESHWNHQEKIDHKMKKKLIFSQEIVYPTVLVSSILHSVNTVKFPLNQFSIKRKDMTLKFVLRSPRNVQN